MTIIDTRAFFFYFFPRLLFMPNDASYYSRKLFQEKSESIETYRDAHSGIDL